MSRATKIDSHRALPFGGRGMKGINFYYVGRRHNCYVKRTKAGTTIAVVRPEEAA